MTHTYIKENMSLVFIYFLINKWFYQLFKLQLKTEMDFDTTIHQASRLVRDNMLL